MSVTSKCGSQDWFYHAPSEHMPPSDVKVIPASQIPGLSQLEDESMESGDIQYKRKWIRDTDSKYTKLAKAGGRKDLVVYKEHKATEDGPVPYPRSDWFDHVIVEEENQIANKKKHAPEWFGHEEHKGSCREPDDSIKRTMLGYDKLNIWKRDQEDDKLPVLKNNFKKTRKCKSVGQKDVDMKLPKILPRGGRKKSIDNGEMNGLLSFTYQKEFLEEAKMKHGEAIKKKNEIRSERREKSIEDREKYTRQKNNVVITNEKPLFKLSRFEKVPPKVSSYRN